MNRIVRLAFFLTLICIIMPGHGAFGSVNILNLRHWTAPDHTRIVLDVGDETSFEVERGAGNIYVYLKDAVLPAQIPLTYTLDKPAVKEVLLKSLPDGGSRVELRVANNVGMKIFKLGKILEKPHRIVIDVMLPDMKKKESEERKKVKILEKKVVVIDPGHGGEDPGAVGRRGTLEKDVVLGISRQLQKILKKRGYEAFLTRKGDYFISLRERGRIAREYGADIFISIHADAHRSRGARGTSVYCLSTRGASSEAAKLLAQNENLSDIIGGSQNGGYSNGESDPITLNMLQTETINRSRLFGNIALKKIKQVNHLKYSNVQEAPFRVLKLPDITSLLIETAYITNSREELMLRKTSYQTDIAWAIAYAVDNFLPLPYAADRTWCKEILTPTPPVKKASYGTYRVKKGDILDRIAARHGTTVRTLMKINNIKSRNRIYVGQKLKIPSITPPPIPSTYVVKRGDQLERIARRHGTTVQTLMKINNIKSRDKIYVGQKLKLKMPSETPAERPAPSVYVVKKGDQLESIAKRYDTTIRALMKSNRIKSRNKIYVGQKLKIPHVKSVPVIYVVKRGDNLESISGRYGTTIQALMKVNNIRSRNRIYIGQKLKIPFV